MGPTGSASRSWCGVGRKTGDSLRAGLVAKLIAWGIDGIITDDPGRLTSMLAARGLRVPPRYLGEKR